MLVFLVTESQPGWIGRDFKAHPVPTPCHGRVATNQIVNSKPNPSEI